MRKPPLDCVTTEKALPGSVRAMWQHPDGSASQGG